MVVRPEPGRPQPTKAARLGNGQCESVQLDLLEALPQSRAAAPPTNGLADSEQPVAEIAEWWDSDGGDRLYARAIPTTPAWLALADLQAHRRSSES